MENQTGYDLNAAIENWRQELAAQGNLTGEVRRELETHLRDAMAGFQQRGLNSEESFWLACKRVGQPPQLGQEFVKADPATVWRERVLWMTLGVLAVTLWSVSANLIYSQLAFSQWFARPASIYFQIMLRTLPFFVFVIYLLQGRRQIFSRLAFLFQSRSRFVITAIGWFTLNEGGLLFRWLDEQNHHNPFNGPVLSVWSNLLSTSIWPLALIALIAWLMSLQNPKITKRA